MDDGPWQKQESQDHDCETFILRQKIRQSIDIIRQLAGYQKKKGKKDKKKKKRKKHNLTTVIFTLEQVYELLVQP